MELEDIRTLLEKKGIEIIGWRNADEYDYYECGFGQQEEYLIGVKGEIDPEDLELLCGES